MTRRSTIPWLFAAVMLGAACAAAHGSTDVVPVALHAPEFDEPPAPAPQPGDDNVVYRLIHRLIPGEAPGEIPPADIASPGPDSANFPNSPYTLPKGRSYIETIPCAYALAGDGSPSVWSWPFLMRTGLTDTCELRIFSQGPTVVGATPDAAGYDGFAPLAFDLKMHLWGDQDWMFWPAVGVEAFLLTGIASEPFQIGTEPGLELLFDHRLPGDWLLEWNVGFYGTGGDYIPDSLSSPYLGVSWALQKQLGPNLAVFYQGFFNEANVPFFPSDLVSGCGAQWNATRRLAVFGSYNWTLDSKGNPSGGFAGFAYAY